MSVFLICILLTFLNRMLFPEAFQRLIFVKLQMHLTENNCKFYFYNPILLFNISKIRDCTHR